MKQEKQFCGSNSQRKENNMDVYEFFNEYARMFKTYRNGVTITNMYITVEGVLPPSQEVSFECSTAESEIDKIIQWSKDNPRKTRLQDFLEKYPNAEKMYNGLPKVCPKLLGYFSECNKIECDRKSCWNEPVE